LVRVYVDSPKLTLPLAGPFRVSSVDSHNGTYTVVTRDGLVRVAGDRVRPAPVPRDLPGEVRLVPPPANPTSSAPDTVEYVIDRIVSHVRAEDGEPIARVRWAGYDSGDDTRELTKHITEEVLKKYAGRKRVSLYSLLP
jgi:hypothetical protein